MSPPTNSAEELSNAPAYPKGAILHLLSTDLVTPQTRAVLTDRLHAVPKTEPEVFDKAEFETLRAACALLMPQQERANQIDLAGAIDDRLARNEGNGWRYAAMPSDTEAYRFGLRGIDECAQSMFGAAFVVLDSRSQQAVLETVQRGEPAGETWRALSAKRFFEELMAEIVEIYYSHPLAMEEIGYAGFADAHGWQDIGLDRLAPHEPRRTDARHPSTDANAGPMPDRNGYG